jgi:hypothetical protein
MPGIHQEGAQHGQHREERIDILFDRSGVHDEPGQLVGTDVFKPCGQRAVLSSERAVCNPGIKQEFAHVCIATCAVDDSLYLYMYLRLQRRGTDSAASEHVGVPDITGIPGVVWIAVIVEGVTGVAPDVRPCTSNGVLAGSTETRLSYCFIKISVSYLCEWVIGMQIHQIVCVQLVRS